MYAIRAFIATVVAVAAAGCSAVLTPAATTYPVTADVDFSQLAGMKRGESCAKTILNLFGPTGTASGAEAARAGGLSHVRYVDNRYDNNIIRQRYCVIAYGE